MSQLRCFSLVGDSNIRRGLSTSSNTSGRPLWSSAQFVPCGRLSTLTASLKSVRPDADACVVACITNFITGRPDSSGSISSRVDIVISGFIEKVVTFCRSRSSVSVFICPPMYRTVPVWYRDGLPEIMERFWSKLKTTDRPSNLLLLASFSRFDLEADGVHLTPYAGMEYLLHLFDGAQDAFDRAGLTQPDKVAKLEEDTVGLNDRLVVLEQDHARLNRKFERKSAETAELLDLDENLRNENFLMVQGLEVLPKLGSKEWQVRAKSDVDKIFSEMGLPHVCRYVQNLTRRGKAARTLYKVCMNSVESSRVIRSKFGEYFAGGQDTRPPALKNISIRNCLTPATLGPVAILQLLGRHYRDSNPGSKFQVVSYEPRPVLKLTPPPDVADKRVQSYNFIEAISKLPTHFSQDEIEGLLKRISPKLHGQLQSIFVVLSEDMVKKKSSAKSSSRVDSPVESEGLSPEVVSGASGRKRGAPNQSGPSAKK